MSPSSEARNPITVRKMGFEFPEAIDPVYIEGDPERSFGFVAASLLLPYLEPYLIRTMSEAKSQVRDPDLLDDLVRFSAQEGQHYRVHMRFNAAVRSDRFPRLEEFERELESDYRRFSETKSLRFNLAYAEGFEALTMNLIHFLFEHADVGPADSPVTQMWEWHFMEEMEHRTVAFEVYDHVCGGYFYRLGVGLYAQWHFSRWIARVARYMLEVSPRPERTQAEQAGRREMNRMARRALVRFLLPNLLRIYLPGYTPRRIGFSAKMQALAERYSEMAVRIS